MLDERRTSGVATGPALPYEDPGPGLFDRFEEKRPEIFELSFAEGGPRWTWDEWRRMAHRAAVGLRGLGITRGSRVACILTNVPAACAAVPGTWLLGASVLSFPTIARGMSLEVYLGQLRRITEAAQPDLILVEAALADGLQDAFPGVPVRAYESLDTDGNVEPDLLERDELAFVQYSSGSTSDPTGCMLSAGAIARQVALMVERVGIDPEVDAGAAWLPLSHDMGLFGMLMNSFIGGMRLHLSTPQRFIRSPGTWMEDCAAFGATITVGPNFAVELATRAARVRLPDQLRLARAVIGGERVEPRTVAEATALMGPVGLTDVSLVPAYGLAEVVLAVSMKPRGERTRFLELDQAGVSEDELVDPRPIEDWSRPIEDGRARLVSNGVPLPGFTVRIDGEHGIGEICIASPSIADGYLGNPERTAAKFVDGEIRTGDIGFVHEDEVYILGRVDDMVAAGGRNIFARDVEMAVGAEVAIRPGSCVLVQVPDENGASRLLAIAEPEKNAQDFDGIARSLADATRRSVGFRLDECLIIPPGTLPKTPSGKVQRYRCRDLFQAGEFEPLARVSG